MARKIARALKIRHRFQVVLSGDENYGWVVPLQNGYLIGIRTFRKDGRPMAASTVVDTLCHEIAHFSGGWAPSHGPDWRRTYQQIKRWSRRNGVEMMFKKKGGKKGKGRGC